MQTRRNLFILFTFIFFCSCSDAKDEDTEPTKPTPDASEETNTWLTDRYADAATVQLYKRLESSAEKGVMTGHHESNAYGVGWWGTAKENTSDIEKVTGYMPALVGWDFSGIDIGGNKVIDGVSVEDVISHVKQVHKSGGINTFCWHAYNPVTEKDSWTDVDKNIVKDILPKGKHYKKFRTMLQRIAEFNKKLVDDNGKKIPIIFRPWHEHTGNWFWWGAAACTDSEYKELWRTTVKVLRDTLGVHNFLYAYSPSATNNESHYMERYPGKDYTDILGFDDYWWDDAKYAENMNRNINIIKSIGRKQNKVIAVTETGYEGIKDPHWFTEKLYPIIADKGLAYVLFWRNADEKHHYVPYPGHSAAQNFKEFVEKKGIILLKDN